MKTFSELQFGGLKKSNVPACDCVSLLLWMCCLGDARLVWAAVAVAAVRLGWDNQQPKRCMQLDRKWVNELVMLPAALINLPLISVILCWCHCRSWSCTWLCFFFFAWDWSSEKMYMILLQWLIWIIVCLTWIEILERMFVRCCCHDYYWQLIKSLVLPPAYLCISDCVTNSGQDCDLCVCVRALLSYTCIDL